MSISRLFPDAAGKPELIERLEGLSESFSPSPDIFFAKWEAFAIKQINGASVTDQASLDAFQAYLEKGARSIQSKKPRLMPRQAHGDALTPKFRPEAIKPKFFSDSKRPTAQVVHQFNGHISTELESKVSSPASFNLNTDIGLLSAERPFNAQLRATSTELDNQIERIFQSVSAARNLTRTDFVNPHQITQNVGWTIGRIVREPPQLKTLEEADEYYRTNAKLDTKSMLLECSRRIGGGSRTSLDFSLLPASKLEQLFEGQIVALKGTNPKGEQFIVDEIVDLPKLPPAHIGSSKRSDGPIRIAVAGAPGTVRNLENLMSWLYKFSRQSASLVVLVGPLLDAANIPASSSLAEEKTAIKDLLQSISRSAQIPIVLVPSPADALSIDPLFPQPAYPDSELPVEQPLIRVSNPCTFSVDEVAVAVAANTCIKDMQLSNTSESFRQVLRQRRLYPVYPPPPNVNVDVPLLKNANIGSIAPNMLVIPSKDGKTECGVVDDVLYIALGALDDGFAVLTVKHGTEPLNSRIGVDIMQLN